jgi:type VI protein secretion system component VasK
MTDEKARLVEWVIYGGVPLLLFFVGLWWRIDARREKAVKEWKSQNEEQHEAIRQSMDDKHQSIRDKIEEIWKHLTGQDR